MAKLRWNLRQPSPHCYVDEINVSIFFLRGDRRRNISTFRSRRNVDDHARNHRLSHSTSRWLFTIARRQLNVQWFSSFARYNPIILIKGYGFSEYVCHEKNTSQTIYRIGSVTKPFTAIIILRLGERKQLPLHDRLLWYCPGYQNVDKMSMKHLLSNTSGIEDYNVYQERREHVFDGSYASLQARRCSSLLSGISITFFVLFWPW